MNCLQLTSLSNYVFPTSEFELPTFNSTSTVTPLPQSLRIPHSSPYASVIPHSAFHLPHSSRPLPYALCPLPSALCPPLNHPHFFPFTLIESPEGDRSQLEKKKNGAGPGKLQSSTENFYADIHRQNHSKDGKHSHAPHDKFSITGTLENRRGDHINSIQQ